MDNEPPQRNFAVIADHVVSVIKYYDDTKEAKLQKLQIITQLVSGKPHIIMKVYEKFQLLETENKMDLHNYEKFVKGVQKIKRGGIYLPPDARQTLWEKFAKLCYVYLNKYKKTNWAQQSSSIVIGLE